MLTTIFNALLVIFAFGFVIFWHELGHFLAARWAKVRVEQFAVGMGQAIVSYRKGLGAKLGSSRVEYDRRTHEWLKGSGMMPADQGQWSEWQREQAANALGLGTTEYRLSWIPLGGYVKPTGQDDLRPASQVSADDPHSFGAAPVGKRMVIISAGVIMNVILAFALYIALFIHGFNAPPAVIGTIMPGSPAQAAGLLPGDRILSINGDKQRDFTKIQMNVALVKGEAAAEMVVDRPGEGEVTLSATPQKSPVTMNLPALGLSPAYTLNGPEEPASEIDLVSNDVLALAGGGQIVKVDGVDVSQHKDSHVLEQAIQKGRPVPVTVRKADGTEVEHRVIPSLIFQRFDNNLAAIAGMVPRARIEGVRRDSPAQKAGLADGDAIRQLVFVGTGDSLINPSPKEFLENIRRAADEKRKLLITREREGQVLDPVEIDPTFVVESSIMPWRRKHGIGAGVADDLSTPIVATVVDNSPAARAGLAKGDRIASVNGVPVEHWQDVIDQLRAAGTGEAILSVAPTEGQAEAKSLTLALAEEDARYLAETRFTHGLHGLLKPLTEVRKTTNPLEAAAWGVEETQYSIFQVYTTLRRLFEGSVPLSGLSGPLGIFTAGNAAATRGTDWLIWFTALISANLAVVNFLPIPIVDGGLFVFLLLEKITGRPPSPKVQTAAQLVGLVLLGSLFLFVTYHDILRQMG